MEDWIINDILSAAEFEISEILPSEWSEQNRFMTSEVSPIEGMFSFENSPYTREIIDCLSPHSPVRTVAIMKGAQIGLSTSVIENGIGYIISEQPGNIMFLVGHDDLVEKAMNKVDNMLDTTGTRRLIRSNANRTKNNKSGDKDRLKEFSGGSLTLGPANHKTLRQVSMRYGFFDDLEAMKSGTKESGGTIPMIEQRFAAYEKSMKIFYISTPELEETSLIEPEYKKGDERKYHIPCPCCGEHIVLEWETKSEYDINKKAGITWQLDENYKLINSSIGYTCQKCDGFFTDQNKKELLLLGEWIPTNHEHTDETRRSYHISALYAPIYMYGWKRYVQQYLLANPPGQERDEVLHQTFVNVVLGQTYKISGQSNDASELLNNVRNYKMWTLPEKQSIADGNGKIVLVTFASDMNGTIEDKQRGFEHDARMDWEVVAWSQSGATYSVAQGSIGTFVPSHLRDESFNNPMRQKWTYQHNVPNSVWDEVDSILSQRIQKDNGGKSLPIMAAGIDSAPYTEFSYPYFEKTKFNVYGLKGGSEKEKWINLDTDTAPFKISREYSFLWIVNGERYKDLLSTHINLKWDKVLMDRQPNNFMNFPLPEKGHYTFQGFFSHFEAEHKAVDKKTNKFMWSKKEQKAQNHFFDTRLYNMTAKDLFLRELFIENKIKNGTWPDYLKILGLNPI